MEAGTITAKTVISWVIGLVPLLLFYFEYQRSKKQSGKKLGELEKMIIKEIVARKDLEKKVIEDKLELAKTFLSQAQEDSERYRKEMEKLENINDKLRFKLVRNKIKIESIDVDETPFKEWEKDYEEKRIKKSQQA